MLVFQIPHKPLSTVNISVNKGAKSFLSNKYQDWYAAQVTNLLERGVDPPT